MRWLNFHAITHKPAGTCKVSSTILPDLRIAIWCCHITGIKLLNTWVIIVRTEIQPLIIIGGLISKLTIIIKKIEINWASGYQTTIVTVADDVLVTELSWIRLLFRSLVLLVFLVFVSISDFSCISTAVGDLMIMYGSTTCILRACRHCRCIGLWWWCSAPDWGVSVDMMKGWLRSNACLVMLSRSLVRHLCFWTSSSMTVVVLQETSSRLPHDISGVDVSRLLPSTLLLASSKCTPCNPMMVNFSTQTIY